MKMKSIPVLLSAILLPALAQSAQRDIQDTPQTEIAISAVTSHMNAVLRGDTEKLRTSYAPQVTLMRGHEFLKPRYGLTEKEGRNEAIQVERGKFLKAFSQAAEKRPKRSDEKISALLESLQFTVLKIKEGKVTVASTEPGNKIEFQFDLVAGDLVVKGALGKGDDFILFHLRPHQGSWQIVSEYLD